MKNREYLLVLSCVILLIACAYLFVRYRDASKMQEDMTEIMDNLTSEYGILDSYHTNRCHEFTLNGTLIDGDEFVSDTSGTQYKLVDILGDRTLVLRYSKNNCLACIEAQLETIGNTADTLGLDVVLLASHPSDHEMKRFVEMHEIKNKVYNLGNALEGGITDIGAPYYFVVRKDDMRTGKMFVPMKESPELTTRYLGSVMATYR